MKTFHKINGKVFELEEVSGPSIPKCKVMFELGIAEAHYFNYLDSEETKRILKLLKRKSIKTLDFFCAIRYYKLQQGKRDHLKFDYYMLRFLFDRRRTEIHVYHEKGPRHVSPSEIVVFITGKVKELSSNFGKIISSRTDYSSASIRSRTSARMASATSLIDLLPSIKISSFFLTNSM